MRTSNGWEAIADKASTIITLVEWGVRLLACAAPPAIGCLWNLLISALQAAFAMLIQTCWFTKKVYAPVLNTIQPVRDFPTKIAKYVVDQANAWIPLPSGMEPLFAEIRLDHNDINVDCEEEGGGGAGALTPERRAILEMVEEIGRDKFCAMLDLMRKRGAGPWVLLTVERLAELKKAMANVTVDDLKKAAAQPDSGVPVPLQKFLADISQYSKQEKALIREDADRRKAQVGGKEGGGDGAKTQCVPPISRPPGAPDKNTVTPAFSAITLLAEALAPGGKYPGAMDVYLVIGINDGKNTGIAHVFPVSVKVQSVGTTEVVFVNQQTFYAYYFQTRWLEIKKDYPITIPRDRVSNVPKNP